MDTTGEWQDIGSQWDDIRERFPEAGHALRDGWHYGFLRHADPVIRSCTFRQLIDDLTAREDGRLPGWAAVTA